MTKKIVSILIVVALAVSLLAGSAFAVSVSGNGSMIPVAVPYGSEIRLYPAGNGQPGVYISTSGRSGLPMMFILPYPLLEGGSFTIDAPLFLSSYPLGDDIDVYFYDSSCDNITFVGITYGDQVTVPAGTCFISISQILSSNYNGTVQFTLSTSSFSFYNFDYDMSSSGGADLSGISDIISSWQEGSYDIANTSTLYDIDNASLISSDFTSADYQQAFYTLCRSSTLMSVLHTQMWYNTSYDSEGNVTRNGFTFYRVNGAFSNAQTVVPVSNLPEYLNQLGSEVTSGLNKLQRDNVLIWDHVDHTLSAVESLESSVSDALYTDKTENQPWSVAQWLKDIYTAVTSFFSSFWSPAETDLKTAAEDGMQAAADNVNAASGSQVDDVNSAADAFKEFGSTGNIGSGDVMDIFSDGASYDFFSQTTKDNLAYHPPAGSQRLLRSSSAPSQSVESEEEIVDELDDKLSYWREVLGLP